MTSEKVNHGHSEWVVLADGSRWVPRYVYWCPRCRDEASGQLRLHAGMCFYGDCPECVAAAEERA